MMPMLRFLRRKMWNNRGLTAASLIGLLLAVAFTASIPLYSEHALTRIVAGSLDKAGTEGAPPGSLLTRYQAARSDYTEPEELAALHAYMTEALPESIGYPLLQSVVSYSMAQSQLKASEAGGGAKDNRRRQMSMMAQSGLAEQVEMVSGAMYAGKGEDSTAGTGTGAGSGREPGSGAAPIDILEAVVSEDALGRNYLSVGGVYEYTVPTRSGNKTVLVEVTGVFRPLDESSAYWYQGTSLYGSMLLISPESFAGTLLEDLSAGVGSANWYGLYDLGELKGGDLGRLEGVLQRLEPELFGMLRNTRVDISPLNLIQGFQRESLQLQALLLTLAAPMLAMCFYYIHMNARQSLDRQRNDIAVLRSRGAQMGLIYLIFLVEALLLGAAAWAAGMPLAAAMARLMVATDGFMAFAAGKEALVGWWSPNAALYGAVAVAAAVLAGTLPVAGYGRQSIVDYKKELARVDRAPLWQRLYLDAALVALSGFGWYMFSSGQLDAGGGGSSSGGLGVQPLFFLIPAVSVFAAGLLCMRLFPLLLKLLHRMLRRWIPVTLHLVLVQLSRSQRVYYPFMLLLVMTMGLGIYHASAARTIDQNEHDRFMYSNGADVVLQTVWEGEVELYDEDGNYIPEDEPRNVTYAEPPSAPFADMPGVQSSARVLTLDGDFSASGKSLGKGKLMAIDNVDFARSAWWRDDLYESSHPYTLLRWLGEYEQGAIVSRAFAEKHSLSEGDLLEIKVQSVPMEFFVIGITDYWPSLDPKASFVVANIDYVYDQLPLTPYALWLQMEDGAKVMPVVEHLRENGIETASIGDARNDRILQRLLPSREGVFGILSLGFIVSVAVSFIGYLLFWLFSLSRRTVQMGIFRATGLSRSGLTAILLIEQLLTTGLAIALGLGIGRLASRLFLPFLQEGGREQVPPFSIIFDNRDTVQLLIIVLVMIVIGAGILAVQIGRLKVHQAVKLGEER